MNKNITVKVLQYDAAGRGLVSGDPRILFGKLPASISGVKKVLYDFIITVELGDGEKTIELVLSPLIDADELCLIAWNWDLEDIYYVRDEATPEEIDDDCLMRFFDQEPDFVGEWKLKDVIQEKLLEEINLGLPIYVESVA